MENKSKKTTTKSKIPTLLVVVLIITSSLFIGYQILVGIDLCNQGAQSAYL